MVNREGRGGGVYGFDSLMDTSVHVTTDDYLEGSQSAGTCTFRCNERVVYFLTLSLPFSSSSSFSLPLTFSLPPSLLPRSANENNRKLAKGG